MTIKRLAPLVLLSVTACSVVLDASPIPPPASEADAASATGSFPADAGGDADPLDAGSDVDPADAGAPSAEAATLPSHAPRAIAFADNDAACSRLTGRIVVTKAADESDVATYAIYWGASATSKLDPLPMAVVPASGADVVHDLEHVLAPLDATHLLVFSRNGAGEMASGASVALSESRMATHTDISAAAAASSGFDPSTVVDVAGGKLLIVNYDGANGGRPGLFRCNLDGTGCTHTDISAGQGLNSGMAPSAVVDTTHGKLLVVATNQANANRPSLFRCNVDGTSCTHTDISAGQGVDSGESPNALVDSANGKLLVVTRNPQSSGKTSLFRCNLDGTSCTHAEISAGQASANGHSPSAVIDAVRGKLLVVTRNAANDNKPSLFRCGLDGTSCAHVDISAGQGKDSGGAPVALVDSQNDKLLVVTWSQPNGGRPSLFRCNLDGTSCIHADISAGQAVIGGSERLSPVIDSRNRKLLVVAANTTTGHRPSLLRCNLDGTACTLEDVSAGQGEASGYGPSAVLDPTTATLRIATENYGMGSKPSLFSVCTR